MAGRRLEIDIDGDPAGFDAACSAAERAARSFDRELERLQRAQEAQERQTRAAARATQDMGRSSTEAGQAARRMGIASQEAGERSARAQRAAADAAARATVAQRNAADAAQLLARGELSASEAAQAQARATREVERATLLAAQASRMAERADLAQAAAARAAARAADELAQQQRQAAIAAGLERLALLRTQGSLREHNSLLTHLRRLYGDLGRDTSEMSSRAGRAFRMFQNAGTSASGMVSKGLAKVGEMGPLAIAGIAFGIAALPALAVAAGGIITLALGGALAGIGIMAAAKNAQVKQSFSDMTSHVKSEVGKMAAPFVPVLIHISGLMSKTFDKLAPSLKGAFAQAAPAVSHFADQFAKGMERFGPTITRIGAEFGPLLSALGDQMPAILGHVADGIDSIVKAAAGHEADIAGFVTDLSKIVSVAGDIVEGLGHVFDITKNFASFPDDPWSFIKDAVPPLNVAVGLWKTVSGAVTGGKDALKGAATASNSTADALANMGKKTLTAAEAAKQLKTNLDALTGTALSARDAAANYAEALFAVNKSLHDNGAAHGFATVKGVANERALSKLAETAKANAEAMTADGKSVAEVNRYMDGARQSIVATALKMHYSSLEAQLLANRISGITRRLSELPSGKKIKITADIAAAMQNIYTVGAAAAALGAGVKVHAAKGGRIGPGYAAGGMIRHMAAAGMVAGPGTGTSDSIPTMLSNGEFVVNARETAANRSLLEAINSGRWGKGSSSPWGKASQSSSPWGKATYDPWGKESVKPSPGTAPAGMPSPRDPSWWHGQADTNFGVGNAHLAWGSTRPEVATTAAAKLAPKPTSPWGKATYDPWGKAEAGGWAKASAPAPRVQLEINAGPTRLDALLVEVIRKAVNHGGGDVQAVLGRSA